MVHDQFQHEMPWMVQSDMAKHSQNTATRQSHVSSSGAQLTNAQQPFDHQRIAPMQEEIS
jgi:hypothetical protein